MVDPTVCHIPPEAPTTNPAPANLPGVPPAQPNIPSLVNTVNALRQIIQVITGQQGTQGRPGIPGRNGQNTSAKGSWNETHRTTEKVKIYQNNDPTTGNFIEVEQINSLVLTNKDTGQKWTWNR